MPGEPWCSSGNLWPNGNLVATGGTFSGVKGIRMLPKDDPRANFIERRDALGDFRWYVTKVTDCTYLMKVRVTWFKTMYDRMNFGLDGLQVFI